MAGASQWWEGGGWNWIPRVRVSEKAAISQYPSITELLFLSVIMTLKGMKM